MNENINLCKILKDCQSGTRFWSPMLGNVEFLRIIEPKILVNTIEGSWEINSDSTVQIDCFTSAEPMLFPSREQRDWSKVEYKPKFDPKTLKAFDRVLVKGTKWECRFFNRLEDDYDVKRSPMSIMTNGGGYSKCIPYNYETKHLVGTSDEAPEYYRYWED